MGFFKKRPLPRHVEEILQKKNRFPTEYDSQPRPKKQVPDGGYFRNSAGPYSNYFSVSEEQVGPRKEYANSD